MALSHPRSPNNPDAPQLDCTVLLRRMVGDAFEPHFRELCDLYPDELCDAIVMNEVADIMSSLLCSAEPRSDDLLELYCDAIERCCVTDGVDAELDVYAQCLALLAPPAMARLWPYFGPATIELLEQVDAVGTTSSEC